MKPSLLLFGLLGSISALELDPDDSESIKRATKVVAAGLRKWYTGDRPGDVPGNLPDPYYWWVCGAMFNAFIDYWYYTGDDTYNNITSQGLVHQIGDRQAFMPPNQTSTLGNDDQGFWGMTAMSAAENAFPEAGGDTPSWLSLAQAVFNTQAHRWHPQTCGGGLKWQIFSWNQGYDYKNTISNGAFFNIGARLAKYTGNKTYIDWATRAWDWEKSIGLISEEYMFYDGSNDERLNCSELDHTQWTYNAGVHIAGAAALWNITQAEDNSTLAELWKTRLTRIIESTHVFFNNDAENVMFEVACERNGLCNDDQRTFKAYLARWMGYAMQTAPWTRELIMPRIRASALAAARQCNAGENQECGLRWWLPNGENDGLRGVGEQMSALEVMQALLVAEVSGPVGNGTGGLSESNPNAGGEGTDDIPPPDAITMADKVGAGFLTALVLGGWIGGAWWLITGS